MPAVIKSLNDRILAWERREYPLWIILAGILAVKCTVICMLVKQGFFIISLDEDFRLFYAWQWSRDPSFSAWGNLWLSGYFWITGVTYWLFSDPIVVARFCGVVFSLIRLFLLMAVAKYLFGRRVMLWAGLLISVMPYAVWQSISNSPILMFQVGMLACFYGLIRVPERPAWMWLAACGLVWAIMNRYEAWTFIPIFVLADIVLSVKLNRSLIVPFIRLVILLAFPAVWMIHSHIYYGDALRFVHLMQNKYIPHYPQWNDFWFRFWFYPSLIFRLGKFFFTFALGAIVFHLYSKFRRPVVEFLLEPMVLYVLLHGLFLLGYMTSAIFGTAGVTVPKQYVSYFQVAMLPFMAWIVDRIVFFNGRDYSTEEKTDRRLERRVCYAGLFVFVMILLYYTLRTADFPDHPGMSHDGHRCAVYLRQEAQKGRLPEVSGTAVLLSTSDETALDQMGFFVLTGYPGNVFHLTQPVEPYIKERLKKNNNVLVVVAQRDFNAPGAYLHRQIGFYKIYRWHAGPIDSALQYLRPLYVKS